MGRAVEVLEPWDAKQDVFPVSSRTIITVQKAISPIKAKQPPWSTPTSSRSSRRGPRSRATTARRARSRPRRLPPPPPPAATARAAMRPSTFSRPLRPSPASRVRLLCRVRRFHSLPVPPPPQQQRPINKRPGSKRPISPRGASRRPIGPRPTTSVFPTW